MLAMRRLTTMPLWSIYVLCATLLVFAGLLVPFDQAFNMEHPVSDAANMSVGLLKDVSTLMTTVDTAMLGGSGVIFMRKSDSLLRSSKVTSLILLGVFFCGATTYFGAYYMDITLLSMADAGFVSPLSKATTIGLRLEYGGVGLGVFLLGLALSIMLDSKPHVVTVSRIETPGGDSPHPVETS